MAYYAKAPDQLSTDPIEGGIEIPREHWHAALDALCDPDDARVINTEGGNFSLAEPPPPEEPEPEPPTPGQLAEYAAGKRRAVVWGGSTVDAGGGRMIPVWTDPESTGAITALVVASQLNPALTTDWKGSDGDFYSISASEILALALGMMAHVQSAFQVEKDVKVGVEAETITTTAQIDAAAWPT